MPVERFRPSRAPQFFFDMVGNVVGKSEKILVACLFSFCYDYFKGLLSIEVLKVGTEWSSVKGNACLIVSLSLFSD